MLGSSDYLHPTMPPFLSSILLECVTVIDVHVLSPSVLPTTEKYKTKAQIFFFLLSHLHTEVKPSKHLDERKKVKDKLKSVVDSARTSFTTRLKIQ